MATDAQRSWNNGNQSGGLPHFRRPKLTPQQRDDISRRLADGDAVADLALEYGVSRRTIDFYR
jgi:DNA-binding NarL/FixJ family response regulator